MMWCKDYSEWCEELQKECVAVIFGNGCSKCGNMQEIKTGKEKTNVKIDRIMAERE